jgi:serine/threonine protein kinase
MVTSPPVALASREKLPSSSRYELLVKIASGGMASVYVGRLSSAVGVSRLVAIKRAHPFLLEQDPSFSRMLVAEATLASRIHHPNVVAVQNVEEVEGELLLIMDYVEGASLAELAEGEPRPSATIAVRVLLDAAAGLHAAHELTDHDGAPLGIVHRDVSPHNILVGVDGIGRITDFGIARSTQAHSRTTTGTLKGKVSYMAPEYVESGQSLARGDIFSLGVVAWEMLTQRRLFRGSNEANTLRLLLALEVPAPSSVAPWLGRSLDAVVLKALSRRPSDRYSTAAEFGDALESAASRAGLVGKHTDVANFVKSVSGEALAARRHTIARQTQDAVSALGGQESTSKAKMRSVVYRLESTGSLDIVSKPEVVEPVPPAQSAPGDSSSGKRRSAMWLFAAALVAAAPLAGVAVQWSASRNAASVAPSAPPKEERDPSVATAESKATVSSEAPPTQPPPSAPAPVDKAPAPVRTAKRHGGLTKPPSRNASSPSGLDAASVSSPSEPSATKEDKAPPNPYDR